MTKWDKRGCPSGKLSTADVNNLPERVKYGVMHRVINHLEGVVNGYPQKMGKIVYYLEDNV